MSNIRNCFDKTIPSERDSGIYQILIRLSQRCRLSVGKLGFCRLDRGFYTYTGSAKRNLRARVARHVVAKSDKPLRWHIDYLLACQHSKPVAYRVFDYKTGDECLRNLELIKAGASVPIRGFGSSDCKRCPGHLVSVSNPIVAGQGGWNYLPRAKAANCV